MGPWLNESGHNTAALCVRLSAFYLFFLQPSVLTLAFELEMLKWFQVCTHSWCILEKIKLKYKYCPCSIYAAPIMVFSLLLCIIYQVFIFSVCLFCKCRLEHALYLQVQPKKCWCLLMQSWPWLPVLDCLRFTQADKLFSFTLTACGFINLDLHFDGLCAEFVLSQQDHVRFHIRWLLQSHRHSRPFIRE